MYRRSRVLPLLLAVLTFLLLLLVASRQDFSQGLRGLHGKRPGQPLEDPDFYHDALRRQSAEAFRSAFPYSRTIVVPRMRDDDLSWMQAQLSDILEPAGNYTLLQYVVDDPEAEYHTPENKGHEVMAYLTYMIDWYDKFPDISVFVHGRDTEWHNNNLLNESSSVMLHNLNLDKVARDGYVNLRCQWDPGCPDQIRPHTAEIDYGKLEEIFFMEAWKDLFQTEDVPEVFAQPCCSQFAVTRERLRQVPKKQYIRLREWLLNTYMEDHDSGRIFEYTWQYLFNHNSPVFCPDPRVCHCELYSVCFPNPDGYEEFFDLRLSMKCHEEDLKDWRQQAADWETYKEALAFGLPWDGDEVPKPPESGLDTKLIQISEELQAKLAILQQAAWNHGRDPAKRAAALNRGWADMMSLPRDSPECKRENLPVAVTAG